MKPLFLLLAAAVPATAQIYADFTIADGSPTNKRFTIRFYPEYAPRSVANFLGLAQGNRQWIDAETGATVKNTPFYTGQLVYKVRHIFSGGWQSGIWIGSQSNLGLSNPSDGAGYLFQDEVHGIAFPANNTVYLENYGPNTNGSRLFITSNANTVPYPNLIPIGVVETQSPPAEPGDPIQQSRTNVLNMAAAPADGAGMPDQNRTILDVEIRRVGAPGSFYLNFNELDPNWDLPEVGFSRPFITREGDTHYLRFSQTPIAEGPDTAGYYYTSTDLIFWQGPLTVFLPEEDPDTTAEPVLGVDLTDFMAVDRKRYFRGSSIYYPTTPAPDATPEDATFRANIASPTLGTRIYDFNINEDATGGTWDLYTSTGVYVTSGNLTMVDFHVDSAYTSRLYVSGDNGLPNLVCRFQHDLNIATGDLLDPSRMDGGEWTQVGPIRPVTLGTEFITPNSSWRYFPAP